MNVVAVTSAGSFDMPEIAAGSRADQEAELCTMIGCEKLDGLPVGDQKCPCHMWFDSAQTDAAADINDAAGIIAEHQRVLRGTVVFTGPITNAGLITFLNTATVNRIDSITTRSQGS